MQAVLTTFFFQHDLPLVALAAGICTLAAYAGISLLHHARSSSGVARKVWLVVAAIAVGFGIWSTHFIAMLSYRSTIPLGYDVGITVASLLIAVVITGGGFWFSALSTLRRDRALGGAVAGFGIAAMHYTGMAAVIVGGVVSWDMSLVAASALLGMAFGALSLGLGTIANTIREILVQTGLSPNRLEMEVTETALVEDITRALASLRQIKALGVRISMDDFGTGYASLSNLRAFPFDRIKIDRSFIKSVDRSPQAAAIVRAIVGLGRGLGLSVISEGVESRDELEFLKAEKCPEAQGYWFGRPQPIAAYRHLTHGDADIVWDDSEDGSLAIA